MSVEHSHSLKLYTVHYILAKLLYRHPPKVFVLKADRHSLLNCLRRAQSAGNCYRYDIAIASIALQHVDVTMKALGCECHQTGKRTFFLYFIARKINESFALLTLQWPVGQLAKWWNEIHNRKSNYVFCWAFCKLYILPPLINMAYLQDYCNLIT